MTRLNEYDSIEWFDMVRRLRPDLTQEEFDRMWAEFCLLKEQHAKS